MLQILHVPSGVCTVVAFCVKSLGPSGQVQADVESLCLAVSLFVKCLNDDVICFFVLLCCAF